jgi:hypothetical protein
MEQRGELKHGDMASRNLIRTKSVCQHDRFCQPGLGLLVSGPGRVIDFISISSSLKAGTRGNKRGNFRR